MTRDTENNKTPCGAPLEYFVYGQEATQTRPGQTALTRATDIQTLTPQVQNTVLNLVDTLYVAGADQEDRACGNVKGGAGRKKSKEYKGKDA